MGYIKVRGVGKKYSLNRQKTVRERFSKLFFGAKEYFWALKKISFSVAGGEVLGVIGANGAGKTTVLKVLSGITKPDEGEAQVGGRIANLIELGAGFHPELTGRENVFLQGALLGMRQREISARYADIVNFAELGEFMDIPVKKFSSGMYARLGFAVAIHTEPDILLIDEVLAVGDAAFQTKCLNKIREMKQRGVAIVFVSHNLSAVASISDKVLLLENGEAKAEGNPQKVIDEYMKRFDLSRASDGKERRADGAISVKSVRLLKNGVPTDEFRFGDPLTVEIAYGVLRPIEKPHFIIGVLAETEWIFQASMLYDGQAPDVIKNDGVIECTFERLPLLPGAYRVVFEAVGEEALRYYAPLRELASFKIVSALKDYGFETDTAVALTRKSPYTLIPYKWKHIK